ncbi:Endothelin-converting enzyme 1 [Bulinus truncatus]|nr:Endothelin-converting enzyme 1 [Bulinus truncatus]
MTDAPFGRSESDDDIVEDYDDSVSFKTPCCKGRTPLETLLLVLLVISVVVIIGLAVGLTRPQIVPVTQYCQSPACVKAAGSLLSSVDWSVDPCEDFYQFACGHWLKTQPIPRGYRHWDRFQELSGHNLYVLSNLIGEQCGGQRRGDSEQCGGQRRGDSEQCGGHRVMTVSSLLVRGWMTVSKSSSQAGQSFDKTRLFHQSCMEVKPDNREKIIKQFQSIIDDNGGWSYSVDGAGTSLENWTFMIPLFREPDQTEHNQGHTLMPLCLSCVRQYSRVRQCLLYVCMCVTSLFVSLSPNSVLH